MSSGSRTKLKARKVPGYVNQIFYEFGLSSIETRVEDFLGWDGFDSLRKKVDGLRLELIPAKDLDLALIINGQEVDYGRPEWCILVESTRMEKYLKFSKVIGTSVEVRNDTGQHWGNIHLREGSWCFYPLPSKTWSPIFWTQECLAQLAEFMKALDEHK